MLMLLLLLVVMLLLLLLLTLLLLFKGRERGLATVAWLRDLARWRSAASRGRCWAVHARFRGGRPRADSVASVERCRLIAMDANREREHGHGWRGMRSRGVSE